MHAGFGESAVEGDHFSAHDIFGDLAGFIGGVTRARPERDFRRDEGVIEFPGKEAFAGVAGPEGAVAVEGGDLRFEGEYGFDEFGLPR